ncbi:helix-turn-helix transcriptional regulator [Candidatus Woesearchaeota archaeon]|nr:helix-turn-helix transcriptional regulator [Candidatus Woesearchaeota archaeon]
MECPTSAIADLIGKKWTIVLLQEIALNRDKGFNFIHERMQHVSPKILSKRLCELEKFGIIRKQAVAGAQMRTKYRLTEKGRALYAIANDIKLWNVKYGQAPAGCEKRECVKCEFYRITA